MASGRPQTRVYCTVEWRCWHRHSKTCLGRLEAQGESPVLKSSVDQKGLRLHLDYSGSRRRRRASGSTSLDYSHADAWASAYSTVAAGAALFAGLGVLAYLKRSG
ncbi:CBS domain-containing protein CBSCBSPB5 [Bienertia sinuspersici]